MLIVGDVTTGAVPGGRQAQTASEAAPGDASPGNANADVSPGDADPSSGALLPLPDEPGRAAMLVAPERSSPLAGMAWMVVASALFAVMNLLARLASSDAPWQEVAASRTLIGALVAVSVARWRGAPLAVRDRRLAWARSLCGTGAMLCVFYTLGAPAIALGDAVTLGATSPVFIALLSPLFLGERSGRGLWAATLLAFGGVTLVIGPTFHLAGHLALVATLGALLSALAMMWLRKLGGVGGGRPESPEAISAHFSIVASVVAVALAVPGFRAPGLAGAALLLGTGLAGGLAQLAMTRAYALERAARVGTVGYLGVVLSHVLGAAVLGERPSPHQLAGTALVTGAGLLLALAAVRDARAIRSS